MAAGPIVIQGVTTFSPMVSTAASAATNYVYRNPDQVQRVAEFIDGVLPTPPGGGVYEFIGEVVGRLIDKVF